MIQLYSNNARNLHHLTTHSMTVLPHKMAIVLRPWICDIISPYVYPASSTSMGKIWCARVESYLHSHTTFCLDLFILLHLGSEKCQILPVFGFRHFVLPPTGGVWRNLNVGAQLQTFSYPTVSKAFLYSNSFMGKSYAETPSFKRLRTNRLTDK